MSPPSTKSGQCVRMAACRDVARNVATGSNCANKAAAGTALDLANLAIGRADIMSQRTLDGMPIALGERMRLLVGPNFELPARQLTVAVAATDASRENACSPR